MPNYTDFEGINNLDTNRNQKTMIKKLVIVLSFLIFLANVSKNSYANGYSYKTGCKYSASLNTGCVGSVGYIHITPWQENEKKNKDLTCKSSVFMKRNQKKPNISYPLRNLPKVGSIVEPGSFLIFYQDLERIKRQYEFCNKEVDELYKIVDLKRTPFKTEVERRMCGISGCLSRMSKYNNINGEEDTLMPGNKLEIISYEKLKEGLFAKIKVVQ